MTEPARTATTAMDAEPLTAGAHALADLHAAGAQRLDPLRMHYLDVLATRTAEQHGRVRALLEARLQHGVDALRARLEAPTQSHVPPLDSRSSSPAQADKHAEARTDTAAASRAAVKAAAKGDVQANPQAARSPLVALNQYVAQHAQGSESDLAGTAPGMRPEPRAVRQFRSTWAKLSAQQELTQALQQAPLNAGPINSHMLVLRSLALMRDISPDYLNRFMAYADALLCLDQPLKARPAGAVAIAAKKPRAPRTKPQPAKPA